MKLGVTARGPGLDAELDPRFGRAAYLLVVESDTAQVDAVPNPYGALGSGAGIQSARWMAEKGAKVVLTGFCGPNSHQTLAAADIDVVVGCSGTVAEAVGRYRSGQLRPAAGPNVPGHSGR